TTGDIQGLESATDGYILVRRQWKAVPNHIFHVRGCSGKAVER
ncbi:unnamed protein product, partial [Ectocarpus sp. 12 AP-2014]